MQIVSGAHPRTLAIHHRQCVPQAGGDSPGPEPALCTHQCAVCSADGLCHHRAFQPVDASFPFIRPTGAVLMMTKPRAVRGRGEGLRQRAAATDSKCPVLILIGQSHQNLGIQKPQLRQHVCPGEERTKGLEVSLQKAPGHPQGRTSKKGEKV